MIAKLFLKNKLRQLNIVVMGDIAIDEYKYGKVSRISPEFPVPILHSRAQQSVFALGMAANVCYQMKCFNAKVALMGFIDDKTHNVLFEHNINDDFCVRLNKGYNPIKVRFYEGNFPLARCDIEELNYGEENIEFLRSKLLDSFENYLTKVTPDIVVLSDYDKGVFNDLFSKKIIDICLDNNVPTLVDPKKPPLSKWKNCTYFKPNLNEATNLTTSISIKEKILEIQKCLNCKGVVITQEGNGYNGIIDNELFAELHEPLSLEKVNNKVGAGDAYLGLLAICLSYKFDFKTSCDLAFKAGVKYVQKKHNKFITFLDMLESKIINPDLLIDRDFKLVLTNGCFDILHVGHLQLLKFAKSKGDKLVVAVNSDESVSRLKPGRPFVSLKNRMELLAALECVDFVISFNEDTPLEIIKKINPEILIKGSEYLVDDIVGREFVKEVITCPMVEKYSTSLLVDKIKSQI